MDFNPPSYPNDPLDSRRNGQSRPSSRSLARIILPILACMPLDRRLLCGRPAEHESCRLSLDRRISAGKTGRTRVRAASPRLFVRQRVDGMNDRGPERRNKPEHDPDGRGESHGDRHHPNRSTDVLGRGRLSSDDLVRQAPRTVDFSKCLDNGTRMHGHRPRLTIRKGDIPHQ